MTAHVLSGFSNAYTLFADVLRPAGQASTDLVVAAAQAVKLPVGSRAKGGGLDIAPPVAPDPVNNRNAASVIWEWVAPGHEWPPAFATDAGVWMPIDG